MAADVTQEANDKKQAVPLIEQVQANTCKVPSQVSMDAGYCPGPARTGSEETLEAMETLGVEAFIPTDRREHGKRLPAAPRGRIPKALGVTDRMWRRLQTQSGRAIYAQRKEIVEPVFGQIKQARGFRQFLLRGLAQVQGEWSLICTGHNLLKLWKAAPA